MSRQVLEVVRRGQEAFSRGDTAAVRETVTEDVEWGTTAAFPGIQPLYRGADELERWVGSIREAWARFEVSIDEVLYEGDEAAVIVERLAGSGRGSGADAEMSAFAVYWVRDGRVARRAAFLEKSEALEAAGLSEV